MSDDEIEKLTPEEIHTLKETAKTLAALSRVGRLLRLIIITVAGGLLTYLTLWEQLLKKLGLS